MPRFAALLAATVLVVPPVARCAMPATGPATTVPFSPDTLPGNGLAAHPFLCFGENDRHRLAQTISLVQGGRVTWTYSIPMREPGTDFQEVGTAFMRPNGDVCFNRLRGATELAPDKHVVWNLDAPRGTEIHVVQPAGPGKVMVVVSGVPTSELRVVDVATGRVERRLTLPSPNRAPHLNFRRVHLTPTGTVLAAHLQEGKVVEYSWSGQVLWRLDTPSPWSVVRLKNGNTIVTGDAKGGTYAHEVDPAGRTVWSFTQADCPAYKLQQLDEVTRLANGNTLLVNWCALGAKLADWPKTVQALEVTPDKRVVWALRSWGPDADLGPLSGIQRLDEPGNVEDRDVR